MRIIKQELHYLQDWNRTVNTIPDFSPPADIEAEFANEITPSKLHINDDEQRYIISMLILIRKSQIR